MSEALKKEKGFPNTKEQIPLYHFHLTLFFFFHSLLPSLDTHGCVSTRAVCPRNSSTDEARHFPTLIIPESTHNLLWVEEAQPEFLLLSSGLVAARCERTSLSGRDLYWSRSPCTAAMCTIIASESASNRQRACVRGGERRREREWKRGRARSASPPSLTSDSLFCG